jgi:hypothetical protein
MCSILPCRRVFAAEERNSHGCTSNPNRPTPAHEGRHHGAIGRHHLCRSAQIQRQHYQRSPFPDSSTCGGVSLTDSLPRIATRPAAAEPSRSASKTFRLSLPLPMLFRKLFFSRSPGFCLPSLYCSAVLRDLCVLRDESLVLTSPDHSIWPDHTILLSPGCAPPPPPPCLCKISHPKDLGQN